MLKIRQEQLDMLTQGAENRFEQQLVEHISHNFPLEIRDEIPESLHLRVKLHIATARKYAITTSQDIIDFSALCILLGDNFHIDQAWAKDILTNPANETVRSLKLEEAALDNLDKNQTHGRH